MPSREEAVTRVPPPYRLLSARERSLDAFDASLPWESLVAAVEPAAVGRAVDATIVCTETLLRHALLVRLFGLDPERLLERVRNEDGPMRRFALGAGVGADSPSGPALERFGRRLVDTDIALSLLGIAERMIHPEGDAAPGGGRTAVAPEPARGPARPVRTGSSRA